MTAPASTPASPQFTSLLGFNAGYVDTVGFLALHGLFTAHVTGNFVTLGASLVHGTSGAWAKVAALPVFCLFVFLTRLASSALDASGKPPIRAIIVAKTLLLIAAAWVMIAFGPFPDSNVWPAFWGGMLMVSAMAIQNAMQRIHIASAPPATLMTGNTTQVMMDLADLFKGVQGDARSAAVQRLRKMLPAIGIFALGCALGALAYFVIGMWCFAIPPVVSLVSMGFTPKN